MNGFFPSSSGSSTSTSGPSSSNAFANNQNKHLTQQSGLQVKQQSISPHSSPNNDLNSHMEKIGNKNEASLTNHTDQDPDDIDSSHLISKSDQADRDDQVDSSTNMPILSHSLGSESIAASTNSTSLVYNKFNQASGNSLAPTSSTSAGSRSVSPYNNTQLNQNVSAHKSNSDQDRYVTHHLLFYYILISSYNID